MTNANDQQDDKFGQPSVVAETLHGDKARAEEHEQPEAVAMETPTLVARPGRDTDAADPDTETGSRKGTSQR
jgi:hypothetical protein